MVSQPKLREVLKKLLIISKLPIKLDIYANFIYASPKRKGEENVEALEINSLHTKTQTNTRLPFALIHFLSLFRPASHADHIFMCVNQQGSGVQSDIRTLCEAERVIEIYLYIFGKQEKANQEIII